MGSLWVGRYFRIDVYIHWTFWLLPLYMVAYPGDQIALLPLRLCLLAGTFFCVLLHEYGHALAARGFGIGTRHITLTPIGGIARLERMSERPWEEFWITVAGPAVNVVIALLLLIPAIWLLANNPALLENSLESGGNLAWFVVILLATNVGLVLFNMLPCFPMDGGRVFRAVLAMLMSHLTATRVAVGVGAVMAALLGLLGIYLISQGGQLVVNGGMFLLVAFFVFLAGQQELMMHRARARYRRQVADEEPLPVIPVRRGAVLTVETIPIFPQRPLAPAQPTTATPLALRPSISVSTFDPETGQWVTEPRPPQRPSWGQQ